MVLLLDPGYGMDKNLDPGCLSRIRNTDSNHEVPVHCGGTCAF